MSLAPSLTANVLVLKHSPADSPNYLATGLDPVGVRWDVFCAEVGQDSVTG